MVRKSLLALLTLMSVLSAPPLRAETDDERYTIMRPEPPEPWLAPKYKSPRGTRQHVVTPQPSPEPRKQKGVPPPLYVPQTGALLPNIPSVSGAGPSGRETAQDRAARCAHQAGVYGQAAGERNAYVGGCINQ